MSSETSKPKKVKKARKAKPPPPPPSQVVKGLQSAAALIAYDMLQNPRESGVGDVSEDKQEKVMSLLFHGTKHGDDFDFESQIDLLLTGAGQYAHLYETDEELPEGKNLVLKEEIHRQEGKKYIANVHFHRELLCQATLKTKTPLSGRTILRAAKTTLANVKKSLAMLATADFAKMEDGEVVFSSGNYESPDLDEHILDAIFSWKETNGASSSGAGDDAGDDADSAAANGGNADAGTGADSSGSDSDELKLRKENWTFVGWYCWKAFGPCSPKDFRVNFGNLGEHGNQNKGGGRAAAREATKNMAWRRMAMKAVINNINTGRSNIHIC